MEFTRIEENIINSINAQAENLSNHIRLHCREVAELYKETLEIQLIALSSKLDTIRAKEVLIKIKTILK